MGFEIETVEECPVTKGSTGVMTMTADHIATIAGAVRDKIEWMVLLHGERSTDGYEVRVDRFTVPPQYRSGAEVELAENITLPADCVGVMHSHHSMGAFFSRTDLTELNPRFPSSIVVAIGWNNLGFKYRASGKVVLPCGALGIADFDLAVVGDSKFTAEPVRGQHVLDKDGLKGCTHRRYVADPKDSYQAVEQTQCGLSVGEVVERPLVFGMDGSELLKTVAEMTRKPLDRRLPAHYTGNGGKGFTRVTDEDTGKKHKGRKGKAKYSARRNGLVKLDRPTPPKGYSIEGNCDDCGYRARLEFISETKDWLCDRCIEDLAEQLQFAAESAEGGVIVTDQIDMDEVYGGGWGI